jgi:hypothetical protein
MPNPSSASTTSYAEREQEWLAKHPDLNALLLSHGGERVAPLPDDGWYDLIRTKGELLPADRKVRNVRGRRSRCHTNVALRHLDNRRTGSEEGIVTGFALSRGVWRRHSWLVAGRALVETTVVGERYFGAALDDREAARFVWGEVWNLLPRVDPETWTTE